MTTALRGPIPTLVAAVLAALALSEPAMAQAAGPPGPPEEPVSPAPRAASPDTLDPERRAELARRGAGLRMGYWGVEERAVNGAVRSSESPAFEGHFQRGLDLHLALESTIGVWRRRQEATTTGPLGGEGQERVDSYVVPLFTSLKFYPTRPESALEPFVRAGVGVALGIDDRETTSGGLLGAGGDGTHVGTGVGFTAGAGLDWRFGRAFGLSLGGGYQWVRFGEEIGGERLYRGFGASAGLVYRFRFAD